MEPIDTASLQGVSGGYNPTSRLENRRLVEATTWDIAEAAVHAGIQVPDRKMVRKVRAKMLKDPRWGLSKSSFDRKFNGESGLFQNWDLR